MPERVLVTGASGFIGLHVLPRLVAKGYEVHAVARRPPAESHEAVAWHELDLHDPRSGPAIRSLKAPRLLHLAWITDPGIYSTSPENFRWVEASLRLLRSFSEGGGSRAVVAGTCAEYDWKYGFCSEEVTPTRPSSTYGIAKSSLRQLAEAFASTAEIQLAWGRIFWTYGPHEKSERLVPNVISQLRRQQPVDCTDGRQIRDFLYVEDLADAFTELVASHFEGSVNLASGQPLAVGDVIRRLADAYGRQDLIRWGARPTGPDDPPLVVADTRRLRRHVDWQPTTSLDAGLTRTIRWWEENR